MKISIMGYSGSGKTYLSKLLEKELSVSVLHLDEVKFDKEWNPYDNEVVLHKVVEYLKKDDWIIDGVYDYLCIEERLCQSDLIILLLLPRIPCFYRAIMRKKEREAQGYKHDINAWFIWFLLFGGRTKERRRLFSDIAEQYKDKVVVLKSKKDVDRFIENYRSIMKIKTKA